MKFLLVLCDSATFVAIASANASVSAIVIVIAIAIAIVRLTLHLRGQLSRLDLHRITSLHI